MRTKNLTFLGIPGSPDKSYAIDNKMVLSFASLTTGVRADFKAFIENIMDNFNSGWSSDQPYGKADPIRHFSGTQRTMQITWSTHAADEAEAKDNMRRISALAQMQYPVYENRGYGDPVSNSGGALTNALLPTRAKVPKTQRRWCISAPPLMAVKFANLIKTTVPNVTDESIPTGTYPDSSLSAKRMYGEQKIEGFNLRHGVFSNQPQNRCWIF